jgi:hypothetical protein
MSAALERDGVLVCEHILSPEAIDQIRLHFDAVNSARAGSRAFDVPEIIKGLIGPGGSLGALAAQQAGQLATPVRVLLFDKTPASNWASPGIRIEPSPSSSEPMSRVMVRGASNAVWSTSSLLSPSCKTC